LSDRRLRDVSWIEKKPYPGSRVQPFLSTGLMIIALIIFVMFAIKDAVVQELFLFIFASLTFSVAIFPQYLEFKGMVGALEREGIAKAKQLKGVRRFIPLLSLLVVLIFAPVLLLFAAPPFLFLGCLMGIIVGFSAFQLVFTLYVRAWGISKGLRVSRYNLVSKDERGKRVVLEYGLRAERVGLGA
jgi:hypothetical protein